MAQEQIKVVITQGCVFIKGKYIEMLADKALSDVPKHYIENRIKRDGNHHHITVLLYIFLICIDILFEFFEDNK